MKKELAKQLHQSGFPNLGIFTHDFKEESNDDLGRPGWDIKATCKRCGEVRQYSSNGCKTSDFNAGCSVVSDYYFPSLSELIEACGENLESIIQRGKGEGDNWEARSKTQRFNATTIEESVARLWLAINNGKK